MKLRIMQLMTLLLLLGTAWNWAQEPEKPLVKPLLKERVITVGGEDADIRGFTNAAIQTAIDALLTWGGGTVKLTAGTFAINAPVQLASHTSLVGAGQETILLKSNSFKSNFIIDADYGELFITVQDPSGFKPGMGVQIYDSDYNSAWDVTTAQITAINGNIIYIDSYLLRDYRADRGGMIAADCSLISAVETDNVLISNLTVDGNKKSNDYLNGCRGGAIYLHKIRNSQVDHVLVKDFNGDGISWQITEDIKITNCEVTGCTNSGLHPGTGSLRSLIEGNDSHHNEQEGLFICWRVQSGAVKNNKFHHNGRFGICTGHKDTDMLFEENYIYENNSDGVNFREETENNAPHRNIFRNNIVEKNGGYGFSFNSPARNVTLEYNIIRNNGINKQNTAVFIYKNGLPVTMKENTITGHANGDVVNETVE